MPPLLFEYKVGTTKPDVTGFFPSIDLTTAAIVVDIKNLETGAVPFSGGQLAATFVSMDASGSRVKWSIPAAWITAQAGDYVGWFIATLAGQVYQSAGFYLKVSTVNHTPVTDDHPFIYSNGQGGYASVNDVVQLMRNRKGISEKTDDTFIEMLLADTAMELDRSLDTYYIVPFTRDQPKAWAYIRRIHKLWALAEWYDYLTPLDSGNGEAAVVFREKGTMLLDDLFAGTVILFDAKPNIERPDWPESDGMVVSDVLDPNVDSANVPIFSINNFNRNGRLY